MTALARGLRVLRCFSQTQSDLSTADIARMTRLPHTTVWRICSTLLDQGYLIRASGFDKLRAGLPVLRLGASAVRNDEIIARLRPHLQELVTEFHGAVTLAAAAPPFMVCLARAQGHAVFVASTTVGTLIALPKSSLGWAYMAGLSEHDRAALIRAFEDEKLAEWTRYSSNFEVAYSHYLETGYMVSMGTLNPGLNAAAVPVVSGHGDVLALSCGGLASTFTEAVLGQVGPRLAELAGSLGIRAGHSGH